MSKLIVTEKEWTEAERFFSDPANINAVKLSRKRNGIEVQHSFIKVDGIIYAMAVGEYLGIGCFSKVKEIIIKNGISEELAVKIEARTVRDADDTALNVMKRLDYIKGQADLTKQTESKLVKSKYDPGNEFNNVIVSNQRLYTIIKKRQGRILLDVINDHLNHTTTLTLALRLTIALGICDELQKLQDKGVIHRDIKPENIMVSIVDDTVALNFIDFDFSTIIQKDQEAVITKLIAGSPVYVAPECLKEKKFSFASDLYAVGKFMPHLLEKKEFDSSKLLAENPNKRMTLPELKSALKAKLNTLNPPSDILSLSPAKDSPYRTPPRNYTPLHNGNSPTGVNVKRNLFNADQKIVTIKNN